MTWRVRECPFAIEWSESVLEQIRAEAMEGLFSLPHGGAEIGGVLAGTQGDGCVRIMAARPLVCEYARGPTFTLSGKDHARLAALLDEGCEDLRARGWKPVGWYHSHTRSEILLSERDVDIHNRYFPDPWQVALVVRPHALQPTRAGFFFREANGSIHTAASYQEFELAPGEVKAAQPAAAIRLPGQTVATPRRDVSKRAHKWLWWIAILVGMALGILTAPFVLKNSWTRVLAAERQPSVALMAYDLNGQLQIVWDWAAEPIRSADSGTLEIADGGVHTLMALDKWHLRAATVGYQRIGARVEVSLTLRRTRGTAYEEFTSFVCQPGAQAPDPSAAALRRELQAQAQRTSELERTVAGLRWLIKSGGQKR